MASRGPNRYLAAMTAAAPIPRQRKPDWIRVKAPTSPGYHETRKLMRSLGLVTVCEEAACPNIGECWTKKHATVMILGDTCTRACAFCNVKTGMPRAVDPLELGEHRRRVESGKDAIGDLVVGEVAYALLDLSLTLIKHAFGAIAGAAVGHGRNLLLVEQEKIRSCPASFSAGTVPSGLIVNI